MAFSADYRNSETIMRSTAGGMFGGSIHYKTKAYDDKQYKVALSGIIKNLESNPIKKGEQLNLAGYSYGAVMQAHLAIGLVENGYFIDNLILIGSPTSDNSSLKDRLDQLVDQGKIGKIIRYDIPNNHFSNPVNQTQFLKGVIQAGIEEDNAPHFNLARPGRDADEQIKEAAKNL